MSHDTAVSGGQPLEQAAKRRYRELRRQAQLMRSLCRHLPRAGAAVVNRALGRSDYARWRDAANLEHWWETRTIELARLVPAGSRVIEFGAGRCQLRRHLDASCSYVASDLVARGDDIFVCDLNQRPLPDLTALSVNVAVFAGVLEYIIDVPSVVRWLSTQVDVCVTSYDAVDSPRWTTERLLELVRRRRFGYMNHHEPPAFASAFELEGFACAVTGRWDSQELYRFERRRTP